MVALALLAALATAPLPAPAMAAETVRVGVYGRWVVNWPGYVLEQQRVPAAARVQLLEFRNLTELVDALIAGGIHVALGIPPELFRRASEREVCLGAALVTKAPYHLVTRDDVRDVRDLRGRRFGVAAGFSTLEDALRRRLARHGPDVAVGERIELGDSVRKVLGVRAGRVAAAFVMADVAYREEGQGVRIVPVEDRFADHLFLVTALNGPWARGDQRGLAAATLHAVFEAIRWLSMDANRSEAIAILQRETGLSPDQAARAYAEFVQPGAAFSPDGALPESLPRDIAPERRFGEECLRPPER